MDAGIGAVLKEAAALVGALVLVLGVAWRVALPHVRAFVAEQSAAARQLQPDSGSTAFDRLDRLVAEVGAVRGEVAEVRHDLGEHSSRLAELETRLEDHLRNAAGELTMLRAVVAATGLELVPRPSEAPRRRWYDPDDPELPSWEVRAGGRPTAPRR